MGFIKRAVPVILGICAAGWVAVFAFCLIGLHIPDTVYPEHTEYFYIEDYSGCLNEETEKYIYDEARRLEEATTAQVVVVTVPNTHQDDIEDYSIKLANDWGIGQKETDNGVLLLVRTDSGKESVRLEIGQGLEGAIPDGKAGRILDAQAVDAKKEHKWNKLAGNTFSAIVTEVYSEAGVPCPDSVVIKDDWGDGADTAEKTFADAPFPEEKKSDLTFTEKLARSVEIACKYWPFGVIVILIILLFFFLGGGRDTWRGSGGSYSGGHSGGFHGGGGSFGGGGATR